MQRRNIRWAILPLIAFGALVVVMAATQATPRRVTIQLDPNERTALERAACRNAADSVVATRNLDPPLGEWVEVRCSSDASDGPYRLASSVRCLRQTARESWQCNPPVPNVTMEAANRTIVIDYVDVSPSDAVHAVMYLLSEPTWGGVKVRSAWLGTAVTAYQTSDVLYVSSGEHSFQLVREPNGDATAFKLQGITSCVGDVCYPALPKP